MKAVILAGGLGTRLRSEVPELPKPLAPIRDKPFLAILLSNLVAHGITDITLSVGYRHELIREYFGNSYQNIPLHYIVEDSPLGTGGALSKALSIYKQDTPVFVINGDTYLDIDLLAMHQKYVMSNADVGMALLSVADASRYGSVELTDDKSEIIAFNEKGTKEPGLINAGIYLLQNTFFNRFNFPVVFSLERDCFTVKLHEISFMPYITDGYFIDIGVPDDYLRAQTELSDIIT